MKYQSERATSRAIAMRGVMLAGSMVDERPQSERVVASLTGSRLAAELVRNRRMSNKE
jgi:hypothetical protein